MLRNNGPLTEFLRARAWRPTVKELLEKSGHPNSFWPAPASRGAAPGAGIFGVVGVLIIADRTKGSGRFKLAQGATSGAVSNVVGGFVAKHAGVNSAFIMLASFSVAGLAFLWRTVPETLVSGTPSRKVRMAQA